MTTCIERGTIIKQHGSKINDIKVLEAWDGFDSFAWMEATKLDVEFAIKCEEEKVIQAMTKIKDLQNLHSKAKDFNPETDECPSCYASVVPGRHYKHNDKSTEQYFNCDVCNKDGHRNC